MLIERGGGALGPIADPDGWTPLTNKPRQIGHIRQGNLHAA